MFAPSADSLLRVGTVSLDRQLLRALDFVSINDSTCLVPDYSGDSRFCVVNRDGRLLRRFGSIPTANEDALLHSRPALAQAWRSFIDYNPRNGVLAAATQLGEVLELWNLRDSTHTVLLGPGGEPQFQVRQGYGIPTGIMGFIDVQVWQTVPSMPFFRELRSRKLAKSSNKAKACRMVAVTFMCSA